MKKVKHVSEPKKGRDTELEMISGGISSNSEYRKYLREECGCDFDIDEHKKTESAINNGWKAIYGLIVTGAGLAIAKQMGIEILPMDSQPKAILILKCVTEVVALGNLYSWTVNPQVDLGTLRAWLTTFQNHHGATTNERWMILFQMVLVIAICISTLFGAVYLGIVGVFTYTMNFIGFIIINSRVKKGLEETRQICNKYAASECKSHLIRAYKCIEDWWGTAGEKERIIKNPMQRRHMLIIAAFLAVAILGGIFKWKGEMIFEFIAYALAALTLSYAVISISVMRSKREKALAEIETEWNKKSHGF